MPSSPPVAEDRDPFASADPATRARQLAANLAARALVVRVAPAYARRPTQGRVLASGQVAYAYEGAPVVLWPLPGTGLQPPPPARLAGAQGAAVGHLVVDPTGRYLAVVEPTRLSWWDPTEPGRWLGTCDLGDDRAAQASLASDARLGGAVLQSGDVVVAQARHPRRYRWNPARWSAAMHSTLALGLPPGGTQALLLDSRRRLSVWELGPRGVVLRSVSAAIGADPLAGAETPAPAPGQGVLELSGDGRHLVAAIAPADAAGNLDGTLAAPMLARRGDGGAVAARALRQGDGEDEADLSFARGHGFLFSAGETRGAGGSSTWWARRYTLASEAWAEPPLTFASAADRIDIGALSPDGCLAALARVHGSVSGRVDLWRLDGGHGPELLWMFKPGQVAYHALRFTGADGDTLALAPRPGGALTIALASPPGDQPASADVGVVPGRLHAGSTHYWLAGHLGDHLGVADWS